MAHDINLMDLSLRDALDIAIRIEDDAQQRYGELAEQMDAHRTPEAATFFKNMVSNEKHHSEKLQERRKALCGDAAVTVDLSLVPEIEAPEYGSVRAFMTEHQALRIALHSETLAHEFFSAALDRVQDDSVRGLFGELRDEERQHQELVRAELAKLPPEEKVDPNDFVDAPVAQ